MKYTIQYSRGLVAFVVGVGFVVGAARNQSNFSLFELSFKNCAQSVGDLYQGRLGFVCLKAYL